MGKMKIEIGPKPETPEQRWYTDKYRTVAWRRGRDGICVHEDGSISTGLDYGGATYDTFENNTDQYIPLPPGSRIIITV